MAGGDDLEVTSVLDPDIDGRDLEVTEVDIDFELVGALDNSDDIDDQNQEPARDEGKPASIAAEDTIVIPDVGDLGQYGVNDDIDFELEEEYVEKVDTEAVEQLAAADEDDDIDFELDEVIAGDQDQVVSEGTDFADLSALEQEDDIDYELDEMLGDASEETDFLADGPLTGEGIPGIPGEAGLTGDEVDFDLDEILAEDQADDELMAGLEGTASIDDGQNDIDDVLDFELEEVVEAIPPGEESMDEIDPGINGQAGADFNKSGLEVPVYAAEKELPTAETEVETAPVASRELLMQDIEAMVEKAVRETVGQVLERLLPGLIEDVITRELEKLKRELEEID